MKRIIKSIARAGWAGIGPVRRPLVRKFHLLMNDRQRLIVDEVDQRVAHHFHTALRGLAPSRPAPSSPSRSSRSRSCSAFPIECSLMPCAISRSSTAEDRTPERLII